MIRVREGSDNAFITRINAFMAASRPSKGFLPGFGDRAEHRRLAAGTGHALDRRVGDPGNRVLRLLEERLVACGNILPRMNSIYVWEGKLEEASEVVMIAKTTAERVPELIERVKSLHSYSCPCIVSLAVEAGYPPFLEWVAAGVKPE